MSQTSAASVPLPAAAALMVVMAALQLPGGRISSRTAAAAAAGTGDGEAQLQHHLRIVISTAMVDGRKKGVSGTVPLAGLGMVAAASNQSG